MSHLDREILDLLAKRDGIPTVVQLLDGRTLPVMNAKWGYDDGSQFAHVVTNMNPAVDAIDAALFFTSEIAMILDPSSGEPLWTATRSDN